MLGMTHPMPSPLPGRFADRLAPLHSLFTRPTWPHVLVLVAGAILAPGRRTVTAVLRILGHDAAGDFCTYHRLLNRARWSARALAGRLLHLLVEALLPDDAPVVIGIDDTIERRWGRRIRARGIYRDPVRSSREHFVKASGLRWLAAMLLAPVPWAGRILALPILTVLAPSERFYADTPRAPKTLIDCARQAALQIRRWLPGRTIVLVVDGAFAALDFLAVVRPHACVVTRLRLDASLFDPAPPRLPGRRGRPPLKGQRQPKLSARLLDPATSWQAHTVAAWYGRSQRRIEYATGIAIWYHAGLPPVPLRWVLVRDPSGKFDPQAFLATDPEARPVNILAWFVSRWELEVTFEEARAHLGVETQRQWTDRAVLRTTPALLGLYALVCLFAQDLSASGALSPRPAAWYPKAHLTFSDAIAAVRREIWRHQNSSLSCQSDDLVQIPRQLWNRMADALAYAA
jgi:hypothetical protein